MRQNTPSINGGTPSTAAAAAAPASPARLATGFTPRSSTAAAAAGTASSNAQADGPVGIAAAFDDPPPSGFSPADEFGGHLDDFASAPYDPHLERQGQYGPGPPCLGRALLHFVPSNAKTKTQQGMKDKVLCLGCWPPWFRSVIFSAVGIIFLMSGLFGSQLQQSLSNRLFVAPYFRLQKDAGGFGNWSGAGGVGTPCQTGGRFVSLYLYNVTNAEAVAAGGGGGDGGGGGGGGGVVPELQEVGPWVYGIGWRYSAFNWSADQATLTYDAYEHSSFCPSYAAVANSRPSDDELVIGPNLAYQRAVAAGGQGVAQDMFGDLAPVRQFFAARPARDWLLGYADPILVARFPDHARAKALLKNDPWVPGLLPNMSSPSPPPSPPAPPPTHRSQAPPDKAAAAGGRKDGPAGGSSWARNRTAQVDTGVANDSVALDTLRRFQGQQFATSCSADPANNGSCNFVWPPPPPSSFGPPADGGAAPAPGAVNGSD
eukprot:SAG22_NODE_3289_length_1803_cov_1.492371_1_plen_486_part_01